MERILSTMNLKELRAICEADEIKPCPSFPGYWADNNGFIWSELSRWQKFRRLSAHTDVYGYLKFKCKRGNKLIKTAVHRLVADAWIGPKPEMLQTMHKNGVRTDNRPCNLRYGTAKDNALDRTKHGNCKAAENGRKSARRKNGS